MYQRVILVLILTACLSPAISYAASAPQDDGAVPAEQQAEHTADVLDPPPLPKLEKGEWASKKSIFADALSVEDADGKDLDKVLDLDGTTYSTHIDEPKKEAAAQNEEGDDPVYQLTSAYENALANKYFDYRVMVPGSTYYLVGAGGDSEDSGVYGQSVIAQGNLRFIAVSDTKGDVEIFVSDEVPVSELLQKISDKKETPGPN